MTVTPHSRPDDRAVLRYTLLVWSLSFTALFVAIVGNNLFSDSGAARGEAIRFAVAMAIGQIVGRSAWAIRNAPAARWWSMIVPLLVVAGLTMTAADFTLHWLAQPAPRPTLAELGWTLVDRIGRPAMLFVWVFAMNVLMLHLALLQSRHRAQATELVEARAAAAQAQLAMLRYQLNPHFLFNTLNAISTLVITGRPAAAEEMLSKLSRFLRASLASEPGDFVTLDAELGMLQEYLEIEGVRFGDRLEVDFACDAPAAAMLVPSLILQPLVENAIKYAVGPSRRRVTIKLGARLDGDDLVVTIADDGDASQAATKGGTGVGLRNVRGRLAALYGTNAGLEAVPLEQGFLAIVRLPATPAPDAARETIALAGAA